jgi:hypothetical protein
MPNLWCVVTRSSVQFWTPFTRYPGVAYGRGVSEAGAVQEDLPHERNPRTTLMTTATTGVLFAGGAGPAVRCRTAPPMVGIDFADRCLNTGPMGVRTRGLDIKAGAAKLKADRAARDP